jgi:ribonuclease-3
MLDPKEREARRLAAAVSIAARLGLDASAPHLEEAFTHPSLTNEQRCPGAEPIRDNQRLEFLGDAVLGLAVSELLVTTRGDLDEGQLTFMRASLVNARTLAEIAGELDLGQALRLGRGADATGERDRPNVLADALEALVGAVYLDQGLDEVRRLVRLLVGDRIGELARAGAVQRDAKSRLQELLQARGLTPPRYRVVAEQGPPHAREFWVEVTLVLLDGAVVGAEPDEATADGSTRYTWRATGQGRSKKLAEQAAASAALERLSLEPTGAPVTTLPG